MRRGKTRRVLFGVVMLAVSLMPVPAGAEGATSRVVHYGDDEIIPEPSAVAGLSLQASDPLGLLPGIAILRAHSLGTDVIDVWTCGAVGLSPQEVVDHLDAEVGAYFAAHSRGRLAVTFVAKGSGPAIGGVWVEDSACYQQAADGASGDANGLLLVDENYLDGGGLGGPGIGPSFPDNDRWAVVGMSESLATVVAHELGHTQSWPHSFTTVSGSDYDNALDLMSGNYGSDATSFGTWDLPYDTAVINRYAAGWIDPGQVQVLGPAAARFTLSPSGSNGTQMGVIWAGGKYYTLGARTRSTYDPIPARWQGVEVYEVTPCPETEAFFCWTDPRFDMGFRQVIPLGKVPFDPGDWAAYDEPLAHVIRPDSSKTVAGRTVSVSDNGDGSYEVAVSKGASFEDVGGSVFAGDIEWLAEAGITKGCNPPANTRFCPDDVVTRGQMAAFLHRALPNLTVGSATDFSDDDGLVFEGDIEWLSATGVTKGCNPPVNTQFCPGDVVTRAQMAAFLHRALPGLAVGSPTDFTDDNGLVFEGDIEWLAASGVTKGCNPPANTEFCPGDPVTRGAMAAFLHRALGN